MSPFSSVIQMNKEFLSISVSRHYTPEMQELSQDTRGPNKSIGIFFLFFYKSHFVPKSLSNFQINKKNQPSNQTKTPRKVGEQHQSSLELKTFANSCIGRLPKSLAKTSFLELCCLSLWSYSTDLFMY